MISVSEESPNQPDVLELIALGDAFGLSLYPAASYYGLPLDQLEKPGVSFFVARIGGRAVGTAALVDRGDATAELKRMFVRADARGSGIATRLLHAVESRAAASGVLLLQLETGPKQPEAIRLYEKHGYAWIPAFGHYIGDESSYCMEKTL